MDKDELKIFVKEKKPLLLVITGAVLILILVLCIFFALRGGDKSVESVDNGAWITAEELEKSGLEILPENPEQVQAIADTASEILTELSAVGSDRETMIQTLREAILGLDYGLTEEEAQELSQWLVDWYLEKVESVQNNNQTVTGTDSSSFSQLQADLQEMAKYLEQLDASVTYNKEELQNLVTVQGDRLNTIQEYLDNLKQEISVLHEEFSSYESTDTSHLEESVNTGISNISSLLGTLYESIANTQNEILVKLADSSLGTNEKYEEINNRLGDLTVSINQNLEEIDDHLSSVLDDLMADNDEQNRETIKQLQSTQEQVTTLINEFAENNALQLTQIEENSKTRYESLTQTLTEVNNAITSALEEMRAESSEQNAALVEQLQSVKDELDATLNKISETNEVYFNSLAESIANMGSALNATLESLQAANSEEHASMVQELKRVQTEISTVLSEMDQSNADRYEDMTQLINTLMTDLQTVNAGLTDKLAELKEDGDANTQEIISAVQTGNESISTALSDMEAAEIQRDEAVAEQLGGLSVQLQTMDENLNQAMNQMQAENAEQNAALQELIQTSADGIRSLLEALEQSGEEWYTDTNSNINTKVTELMNNLEGIHNNITSTQLDIRQTLVDIQTADAQRMNQIMEEFYGITTDLAAINTSMDTAHEEIRNLITEVETNLKNEADANQSELLGALTEMDNSFEQANTEGFQNLLDSLQAQAENMKSQFDALNSSMAANTSAINQTAENNKTELLNKLASMESNINNTVNNISTGTSISQEIILERIAQLEESTNNSLSGISGDLQSVFQRVSNGKALLASALLTKNVVIDEDATFQEIYDAILNIKQETVIGVDRIPGTITYEYHHHSGSPENGGGCYTQPSYHQHTGSCYKTCEYWESGCRDVVDTNDDQVKCTYMVKHSVCTNGQEQERSRWHANDGEHHVNSDSSGTHLVVVCGKNEGTFEGYAPTCGLQEGQITGAHIVYDADAVSAAAETYRKEMAEENALAMEKLEELLNSLQQQEPVVDEEETLDEKESEAESQEETEITVDETETATEEESGTAEETEEGSAAEEEAETEGSTVEESEEETVTEETESDTAEETESETAESEETPESETETEEESEETEETNEASEAEEPSSAPEEPAIEEPSVPETIQTVPEETKSSEENMEEAESQSIPLEALSEVTAKREQKTEKGYSLQKGKSLYSERYGIAS